MKQKWSRPGIGSYRSFMVMSLLVAGCQPDYVQSDSAPKVTASWLEDERVAYGMQMDVETYTYRIVGNYGNNPSKLLTDVQASPRLYRQRIESRVLQDGSLELIKTQLQPAHLDMLPPQRRNWKELGPHQIVIKNNVSTFFDVRGRQIGQRQLLPTSYAPQLEQMRKIKATANTKARTGSEGAATGYPVVDISQIQALVREHPEQVKYLRKDLVELRQEIKTEQGEQYTLSRFDTKWGRLLQSEVYDAGKQQLLQRKVCQYGHKDGQFFLKGTFSETYLTDEKTGIRSTEYQYEYLQDVKFVSHI